MNIELYEVVMQDVFDDAPKRSAGAELLQGGTGNMCVTKDSYLTEAGSVRKWCSLLTTLDKECRIELEPIEPRELMRMALSRTRLL
ncbi:MAG: hypothetical protein WCK42_06660 [Myxococcaceae bacterium]